MKPSVTQRFLSLAPRQQLMAAAAVLSMALMAFAFLAWLPLDARREELSRRVETSRETLAFVREAGAEIRMAREGARGPAVSTSSLPQEIDRLARASGVSIAGLQPASGTGLRVMVDGADFPAVAAWLQALERAGLRVRELGIRASGSGSAVDVELLLGAASGRGGADD